MGTEPKREPRPRKGGHKPISSAKMGTQTSFLSLQRPSGTPGAGNWFVSPFSRSFSREVLDVLTGALVGRSG